MKSKRRLWIPCEIIVVFLAIYVFVEYNSVRVANAPSFRAENFEEAGTRKTLTHNGVEFVFRYCPSGVFKAGSPWYEEGRERYEKRRIVTINEPFWICETETTQEQWDAVGIEKAEDSGIKGAKLPAVEVTLYECDAFVKKLNESGVAPDGWRFALPTADEWEYACRAGTTGATYGVPLDDSAWYKSNSGNKIHETGAKIPNNWGVYDMLGNVWEWTNTESEYIGRYVYRGGDYFSDTFCRPASWDSRDPALGNDGLGFRCVLVRSR